MAAAASPRGRSRIQTTNRRDALRALRRRVCSRPNQCQTAAHCVPARPALLPKLGGAQRCRNRRRPIMRPFGDSCRIRPVPAQDEVCSGPKLRQTAALRVLFHPVSLSRVGAAQIRRDCQFPIMGHHRRPKVETGVVRPPRPNQPPGAGWRSAGPRPARWSNRRAGG